MSKDVHEEDCIELGTASLSTQGAGPRVEDEIGLQFQSGLTND
ncbi:benenodin family lasso peptide [Sphingomonas crocodyli]|uniref:Benenodin family lasso peptide n=1 Tax=Sphingomonas crocodyli TaxID=1979270 RepID=A0A437LY72_9SPHN|nr:benenodin family lasso peptide [Sphingomonas crocodyli]RVT90332.1 benenodin family lasso peptide [Sphingomonas crocodyli]